MIPKKCCGMKILIQKKNKLMKGDKMKTLTNTIRQYFLMLTLVCVGVMTAQAATYTVTNANDSGAGSLRDAINQANASIENDTITFASGANGTITLLSALPNLANNGSLTITGNGAANTIISGNNLVRPFSINVGANVALSGLTVTQGYSIFGSGGGGGMQINGGATVTIADSIVSNNVTEAGNGGGGIFNLGSLTIVRSSISGNRATNARGGGIRSLGTLMISGSLLNDNNATNLASALASEDSTAILTNTTISGNGLNGAASAILNVSISQAANLTLDNCTVTGNNGGGIFIFRNSTGDTATTVLKNSIIANNTSVSQLTLGGQNTTYVSQGYNLTSDNGSGFLTAAGDQINTDPLLAPLADNGGPTLTHALLWGSPAIDAGNSTLTTDQRGFARPLDIPSYPNAANGSDIGAFEYQGASPTNKDQCKNGGWMTFNLPHTFKNQGDCIQFVNTGK
jgi:hypothetical protein